MMQYAATIDHVETARIAGEGKNIAARPFDALDAERLGLALAIGQTRQAEVHSQHLRIAVAQRRRDGVRAGAAASDQQVGRG